MTSTSSSSQSLTGSKTAYTQSTARLAQDVTSYTYSAPWGGYGSPGAIYVLGQGSCNDIPASLASGYTWPTFLNTLTKGSLVTITGVPSYADAWSKANNCPTGGIVASNIVIGSAPPSASPQPNSSTVVAVDAGGPSAILGWQADNGFNGGIEYATSQAVDISKATSPAPEAIYQTNRWGSNFVFETKSLTPMASYTVRLHFSDNYWNVPGKRLFGVSINGIQVLNNFDVVADAGGENIAVIKQFAASADASGSMKIRFSAARDNALISGIEIISDTVAVGQVSPSPSPAPITIPSPIPSPITTAQPAPQGTYPIYSSLFTGTNGPFHRTFASLQAAGATEESHVLESNFWKEGIAPTQPALGTPFYTSVASNPPFKISCTFYSPNGCDAQGDIVHLPTNAAVQPAQDAHIVMIDKSVGNEYDMWGGGQHGNPKYDCTIGSFQSGVLSCSWGGAFSFTGSGIAGPGQSAGIGGGYAIGILEITAQELLNGHIDHAMAMNTNCLDEPSVYPSYRGGSDEVCTGATANGTTGDGYSPSAHYGSLIHLRNSYQIASSGYSKYCKVILTALQTYGAYTADTGNNGMALYAENATTYVGTNPWYSIIFPSLAAGGDGGGSFNQSFGYSSCLNRLSEGDLEVWRAPNVGY